MSSLWFLVLIVCVFFVVVLVGISVDQAISDRKRAIRLLERQASGPGAGSNPVAVDLRQRQLQVGFFDRVMIPVVKSAGRISRRITPLESRDKLASTLVLAGMPKGWDAERVMAFKLIGVGLGFVVGLFSGFSMAGLLLMGVLMFVGWIGPDALIARKVDERKKEILDKLSDTLDLLSISVEAGLSLSAAMAQVVQNVPGPLSSEFARMLQEIQLGVPRSEAFRSLAKRTEVEELNSFALAMIQADVFGVSVASVLRTQADQLRIKRRQRAEQRAQETPVKIVFPLVLCFMPSLFVVLFGPVMIDLLRKFATGAL